MFTERKPRRPRVDVAGVLAAVFLTSTGRALIDPVRRDLIEAGYSRPLGGSPPVAAYGFDCFAQPPGPGTSQAAYLFNGFVRRESDTRTKVTVNSFIARPDVPVDFSQCSSTGAFEGLFFATIEKKLRTAG